MAKENSFDIVSKTDYAEIANALNQTTKEISQRFDFKGSQSSIELTAEELILVSDDEGKMRSLKDILESKLVKRKVSLKAVEWAKIENAAFGSTRNAAVRSQLLPSRSDSSLRSMTAFPRFWAIRCG